MAYFATLGFVTISVFPYLITMSVVVTNASAVSSQSSLVFPTFSLGLSDLFGNRSLIFEDTISLLYFLHKVNSRIKVSL